MKKYYHLKTPQDCKLAVKKYKVCNYEVNVKHYWWIVCEIQEWLETNAWFYNHFVEFNWTTKLLKINLSYDL